MAKELMKCANERARARDQRQRRRRQTINFNLVFLSVCPCPFTYLFSASLILSVNIFFSIKHSSICLDFNSYTLFKWQRVRHQLRYIIWPSVHHTILKCFLSMRSKWMITIANRRFPFPNETLFLATARSLDSCQICAVIASNDCDLMV